MGSPAWLAKTLTVAGASEREGLALSQAPPVQSTENPTLPFSADT